jgi:hypothetical protein
MRTSFILLASVLALAPYSAAAAAQAKTYTDADEGYALELPSPSWEVIQRRGGVRRHARFVYRGTGDECRLRVRRELVDRGVTPAALADDEESELRFLPGYVENRLEPFAGRLRGAMLAYEYSKGGRQMAGRTYYLQADGRTIYILRFNGPRKLLADLRGETDSIARSFRLR